MKMQSAFFCEIKLGFAKYPSDALATQRLFKRLTGFINKTHLLYLYMIRFVNYRHDK